METKPISKALSDKLEVVTRVKEELESVGKVCQQMKVVDETSLAIAQQNLSKANQLAKFVEDKREEIKAPYLNAGKTIDKICKDLVVEINKGILHIKSQVKEWEVARRKKEAVNEEKGPSVTTRGVRETWKFEVEDFNKIPKEWLMVDESAVKDFLKAEKDKLKDGQVIGGVKFFKDINIVA